FPDVDPIGRPCMSDLKPREAGGVREPVPYIIVGVVGDSRYSNPNGRVPPLMFTTFALTNTGRGQMVLHLRVSGHAEQLLSRLRQEVAAVDPSVPMFAVRTLGDEMNAALVQNRLIAVLSAVFGVLALTLACVGLHGLLAFGVVQRQGE